ncbi:TetR/AcrR family transcriptional regulator [Streptomyces sp. NPDC050149]|uniref:TetR/AcrR family transcriptional regulator n=1 Tax=unclassified Streptomyces TaxID=2593676 RepID=UPI002E37886F|nr:TetR/AcrR family transcriptional regulator [Streptomyces sp. NBC_01358]
MVHSPPKRRREASHRAILEATRDLLREGGFERLSMDAIAARAGVGKQTLYRWWDSKASVVAEAVVADMLAGDDPTAIPDTGDVLADVRSWLDACVRAFTTRAALIRALTSAAADDRGEAQRLFQRFTGPHRAAVVARLQRGVEAGQVRHGADLDAVADAFLGSLLFQLLTNNEAVAAERSAGLLHLVVPGLLTK